MDINFADNLAKDLKFHTKTVNFFKKEQSFYASLTLEQISCIDGYIRGQSDTLECLRQLIVNKQLENDPVIGLLFIEMVKLNA